MVNKKKQTNKQKQRFTKIAFSGSSIKSEQRISRKKNVHKNQYHAVPDDKWSTPCYHYKVFSLRLDIMYTPCILLDVF